MKRSAKLLLTYLLVLPLAGCGQAQPADTEPLVSASDEPGFFEEQVHFEKTVDSSVFYDRDDIVFDDTYIWKQGADRYVMELKDVQIKEVPISGRKVALKYTETFIETDDVPKTVTVKYLDDGKVPPKETVVLKDKNGTVSSESQAKPGQTEPPEAMQGYEFELPLVSTGKGENVWLDFSAPMTFRDYGAAYYRLSEGVYLPHSDSAPVTDGFEDDILRYLGLSPSVYRISYAEWNGGTYTDSSGMTCRNALMYGQRLAGSTVATYEAEVDLKDVTGYKGTATYTYNGTVKDRKKIAAVAGGSTAAAGAGAVIPIVLFRRRKKKQSEDTAA